MIDRSPFGRTGHDSSRAIFGAAALGSMTQERADRVLETLLEHGVNHIDTAAAYGESELRIGPWMRRHRDGFFLATKTGGRTALDARESLHRSLERLEVDRVDLIQLHNLVEPADWERALGPGGALEALIEAREQGLVRFIGVTGHGTRAPEMHRRSLERFDFDSVLFPYNFAMMSQRAYASDVEALVRSCGERGVAVQTIKSVARRRWRDGDESPKYSWYEPLREPDAVRRAAHYVLSRPGFFLNTSSDATLLPLLLEAAHGKPDLATQAAMVADSGEYAIEPLFVPGAGDRI